MSTLCRVARYSARLWIANGVQSGCLPHLSDGGEAPSERFQRQIDRLLDEAERAHVQPEVIEPRTAPNPDEICLISRKVLTRLRELGASKEDIGAITVDAPDDNSAASRIEPRP